METSSAETTKRLAQLHADIAEQGGRVQALLEAAFEAVFTRDVELAKRVIGLDDAIDRVDVAIEQAAVAIMIDAMHCGIRLSTSQLRDVLTIVKVNNDLERIADMGVNIASLVTASFKEIESAVPETFRVMANSVIGIMRDANAAVRDGSAMLAKVVLQSEDAVEAFKAAIVRDAEEKIAAGEMPIDFAFTLHEIANQCERMADHCTNIAEQVLYSKTGAIVRHMDGGWVEVGL